jgi:ubiquinone/menaquinone biosynthesis C-methylase UbiE
MKHHKVIRREFAKQASSFGKAGLTLSSLDLLDWIVSLLPLEKDFRVLDVAAGTGHLSRAIAPHVREVVAIDITPEMLQQARQEAAKDNIQNISFEEGNADMLPFHDNEFDMVVSRLAIHHIENPIVPLREMVRVCKSGRSIGIIDLLASENNLVAETYNRLERMRDPSHVQAFSKSGMNELLSNTGITLEKIESREVEVDFQRWAQMTSTPPEIVEIIREELLADIHGTVTGMRPFLKDDALKFFHVWSVMIGRKAAHTKSN